MTSHVAEEEEVICVFLEEIEKAVPELTFNLDPDGQRHSLGSFSFLATAILNGSFFGPVVEASIQRVRNPQGARGVQLVLSISLCNPYWRRNRAVKIGTYAGPEEIHIDDEGRYSYENLIPKIVDKVQKLLEAAKEEIAKREQTETDASLLDKKLVSLTNQVRSYLNWPARQDDGKDTVQCPFDKDIWYRLKVSKRGPNKVTVVPKPISLDPREAAELIRILTQFERGD